MYLIAVDLTMKLTKDSVKQIERRAHKLFFSHIIELHWWPFNQGCCVSLSYKTLNMSLQSKIIHIPPQMEIFELQLMWTTKSNQRLFAASGIFSCHNFRCPPNEKLLVTQKQPSHNAVESALCTDSYIFLIFSV